MTTEQCDCCQEMKPVRNWDGLYGCCEDCSHCQSLGHCDGCCHGDCMNTEKLNKLKAEVKRLTDFHLEASKHAEDPAWESYSKADLRRVLAYHLGRVKLFVEENEKQAERIAELEGHIHHHCHYRAKYCPDVPRDQE